MREFLRVEVVDSTGLKERGRKAESTESRRSRRGRELERGRTESDGGGTG